MYNQNIFLSGMKASIFICGEMKYHSRSCSRHGPVNKTIGQPFTFAASSSAPIAHCSKHTEGPPWHNRHNRTDIAEYGAMPTPFWFTMAQLYREVAILNPDFVVIGPKSARRSPLSPLQHCPFPKRLQNWAQFLGRIGHSMKGCSLFSGTKPWPLY